MKKILYLLAVTTSVSFLALAPLYADQLQDTQSKKNTVTSQIKDVQKKESTERANLNWSSVKKNEVEEALKAKGLQSDEIERKIEMLDSAIKSLDEAIIIAQQDYNEKREMLKKRLKMMYKSSKGVSIIDELFKCDDLNELYTKVKMMVMLAQSDKSLIDSIEEKRLEIEDLKAQREIEVRDCIEENEEAKIQIEQLLVSRSQIEKDIVKSKEKIAYYEKQEDQLVKLSKELEDVIKNLKTMATDYVGGVMKWPVPVSKKVSSYYGMRMHPIYKTWKMHTGVDISAKYYDYIVAAND